MMHLTLPLVLCIISCDFGGTYAFMLWPKGTYTLIKPRSGCPKGWEEGWRRQDNEDDNNQNRITPCNNFAGEFDQLASKFYYCTKGLPDDLHLLRPFWPNGNYCILRQESTCPWLFGDEGSIYWDDEDSINLNSYGGRLPSGVYGMNTRINYCCRDDGNYQRPIKLPTSRPFYLMRYRGGCQRVYGMDVREEIVKTDDEDNGNANSRSGNHPMDSGTKNHELHYCYYTPT